MLKTYVTIVKRLAFIIRNYINKQSSINVYFLCLKTSEIIQDYFNERMKRKVRNIKKYMNITFLDNGKIKEK